MVSDNAIQTLDNQELTNELGERSEPLRFKLPPTTPKRPQNAAKNRRVGV